MIDAFKVVDFFALVLGNGQGWRPFASRRAVVALCELPAHCGFLFAD
jgi:hypothetical protein